MTSYCRAPGCGERATRHGAYCDTHKARKRRHGAPDQKGVTKAKLKPFIRLVQGRVQRNDKSPVWGNLDERWQTVVEHARGLIARWKSGKASVGWEMRAAQEVIRLADNVEQREVVVTALGMYLLQYHSPALFRSDAAFRVQLVRRVRGLTDANATDYTDPVTGRMKRAYRELPPRVVAYMADWLVQAVGVVGVRLAQLEREDEDRRKAESLTFGEALSELK